jgi:YbbR domain-containing protein
MPRSRLALALTRNLGLKLVSLAGATLLWTYAMMQPRMEKAFQVAIHCINVPAQLELNPDQVNTVSVILAGPRDRLEELERGELAAEVDFSRVSTAGDHTFNVKDLRLNLPPNVHFVKAVPSQLRLMLENQVRREVGVQPRFVGAFQPGYSMESYTVEPEKLVIVGPESRMALVDQVTTDPIDLSGEIGPKKFQATAYVPDANLRFEGASSVTVEINLRKRE